MNARYPCLWALPTTSQMLHLGIDLRYASKTFKNASYFWLQARTQYRNLTIFQNKIVDIWLLETKKIKQILIHFEKN